MTKFDKRGRCENVKGIGVWDPILEVMTYTGVLTNIGLILLNMHPLDIDGFATFFVGEASELQSW